MEMEDGFDGVENVEKGVMGIEEVGNAEVENEGVVMDKMESGISCM